MVAGPGAGGIAATDKLVLVGDRDPGDTSDTFRAYDAADGTILWTLRYLAPAKLDYGNAPRATPQIEGDKAYLFGATGQLHCVELASGKVLWQKDLRQQFKVTDELLWGACSSPLLVDGLLIVNPGAAEASLVAFDPTSGQVTWQTPGDGAAFSSLIVATLGGKRQIVGYDKTSLGGWEIATGKRLWRLVPPNKNDFNVPTPIVWDDALIVSTENNGTRLYRFQPDGSIIPEPAALQDELAPDSHTPVVLGDRLFGVWEKLFCLDARHGLKTLWSSDDLAFQNYATVVASPNRVLVLTQEGELVLLNPLAEEFAPLSRLKLFKDDSGVYAHPAFVGHRMYLRNTDAIYCLDLDSK